MAAFQPIRSEAVLSRAPELDVTLESNGEISVYVHGLPHRFGATALALLSVLEQPMPMATALARLQPTGEAACDDMYATLCEMVEIGVVQVGAPSGGISRRPYPFGFYDSPGVQIRILDDRDRRAAYLQGVQEAVEPGDVVLDLGAGNGLLAVEAARAGARRVYAVEPAGVAATAKRVFESNGVADRVTVIQAWSEHIDLPEKADVVLHDLVGSEPLDMRIPEIARDALRRHAKPGARVVPGGVRLRLVLVDLPAEQRAPYAVEVEHIRRWYEWYGIDFSPLQEPGMIESIAAYVPPREAAEASVLSDSFVAWETNLQTLDAARLCCERVIRVSSPGVVSAVMAISEIDLGGTVFRTDPARPGAAPHWMVPLWILPAPISVAAGDEVLVTYEYLGRGRKRVSAAAVRAGRASCAPW